MTNLTTQFQQHVESLALDMIADDTGKDVGDFGGLHGLIKWLDNNGHKELMDLMFEAASDQTYVI